MSLFLCISQDAEENYQLKFNRYDNKCPALQSPGRSVCVWLFEMLRLVVVVGQQSMHLL